MELESSFDAADLADAILGAPEPAPGRDVADPASAWPEPTGPITEETPVIPAWAVPAPPAVRGLTDPQRAVFALAVIALVMALIGAAAIGGRPAGPPCDDPPGLFDDSERGLFDERAC